jgi:MscS family membrane protein
LPLILLIGSVAIALLKPLLKILARQTLGGDDLDLHLRLSGPLRLILFGILFLLIGSYSYTLLARSLWHNVGNVLVVVGGTWLAMRMIGIASGLALARLRSSDQIALAGLLSRLLQFGVVLTGGLLVLDLAGVNLTAALTGLGIGGVAVALAAQKTIENLFGGIMIISDRPVRIGDLCQIGDISGTVVDIGLRSTRIRTPERTIGTVPNGQLAVMNLENYTLRDKFWFHPKIALSHQTTVEQMQALLHGIREMLDKHANVESTTAQVRFVNIGNASQDVEIFAYVFAADYNEFLAIQEDLLLRVLDIVESIGTALALPTQVTQLVRESDASVWRPKENSTAIGTR